MKKKIYLLFAILTLVFSYGQVGVKTTTPVNMLDINGDLRLLKELKIGGTNAVSGNAGNSGDIFHNNSSLSVNDWKSIKIADGQGSMSLFSMNTVSDTIGVSFSGANGVIAPYTPDAPFDSNWSVLPETVNVFSVTNDINKVVFTFQTTAQKTGTSSISFACGIFVDNKLKAVRTDVLLGANGTNKIFNLNATLTNLMQNASYQVKAACAKRNLNSGTLGIGRAIVPANLNRDMSQSVLTTSVLQPYL